MKRLFILFLMIIWSGQINAYDEMHLRKFKAINKCPGCDLSGADFKGRKLEHANLQGANLQGVNLEDANLKNARLTDAVLIGANLHDANLSGAFLRGANLRDANLSRVRFYRTNVSNADLRNANLSYADASYMYSRDGGSDFSGTDFRGSNLLQFNAADSDFTGADLTETNIEEGDFRNATLCYTKTPWGIENIGCEGEVPIEKILINSNVPGADVYIDGELRGSIPIELELFPGKYTLIVVKEGYRQYRKELVLKKGESREILITLEEQPTESKPVPESSDDKPVEGTPCIGVDYKGVSAEGVWKRKGKEKDSESEEGETLVCVIESQKNTDPEAPSTPDTEEPVKGGACTAFNYKGQAIPGVWVIVWQDGAQIPICRAATQESSTPTESDETVKTEKSDGDTCPDGMVQTYKGCEEDSTAGAEDTDAAAKAQAAAEVVAETKLWIINTATCKALESALIAAYDAWLAVHRQESYDKALEAELYGAFESALNAVYTGNCLS